MYIWRRQKARLSGTNPMMSEVEKQVCFFLYFYQFLLLINLCGLILKETRTFNLLNPGRSQLTLSSNSVILMAYLKARVQI